MLDRASTFADPEIVDLLKTRFVPVAIDQAYQRRQKDTEGDFYRKIAGQHHRNFDRQTTQGFYIATATGKLLLYNNNRHPEKLRRLMKEKLADFELGRESVVNPIDTASVDPRYNVKPPEGGLVLRVRAKVLAGYPPTDDRWQQIFQSALSRDNFWITRREHQELVRGRLARSLQERLVRFHLVDNTRGEPPMWKKNEIRELDMSIADGKIRGQVQVQTGDGDRGYDAELRGEIKIAEDAVVQFDLVALGQFWGEGRFTQRAPEGKFPLAVSFTLADGSDIADAIPPQGSRGWLQGYID